MQRRYQTPFNWGMYPNRNNSSHGSPFYHNDYQQMGPRRQSGRMTNMNRVGLRQQHERMFNMNQPPPMGGIQGNHSFQNRRKGNKAGGILERIFGKRNQAKAPPTGIYPARGSGIAGGGGLAGGLASGAQGGSSILKALTDPGALNGFLNNTQQVLQVAKQISPIISQYGPLIKNFPTMWKLYRGLKEATKDSKEQESPNDQDEVATSKKKKRKEESSEVIKKRTSSKRFTSIDVDESESDYGIVLSENDLADLENLLDIESKNDRYEEKRHDESSSDVESANKSESEHISESRVIFDEEEKSSEYESSEESSDYDEDEMRFEDESEESYESVSLESEESIDYDATPKESFQSKNFSKRAFSGRRSFPKMYI